VRGVESRPLLCACLPRLQVRHGFVLFALGVSVRPSRWEFGNRHATVWQQSVRCLSIVVAPAILTSASSVLCLGTANRLARVVDRTRAVSAQLAHLGPNSDTIVTSRRQLEELRARWNLVLRALICFYISLGSFAAAALVSLVGSSFTAPAMLPPINFITILGLLSGTVGVGGLIFGCTMMVLETRLAIQNLAEEAEIAALTVQTPVMATNCGGEPASIFSTDRQEEAGCPWL
jgi:hypothetical protein